MKKRLLSMILALSMMLTILPVNAITAWAADGKSGACGGGLTYTMIQNDGTDTYTLAITKSGTGTGVMTDYGYGSTPWYADCGKITKLTIDGATSIGKHAFESCHNLTDVVISSGVTSIGEDAFEFCEKLTNTSISSILKEATSIGDHAFYGCTSLTSVEIPESVTSIDVAAFGGCSNLTSVKILGTITSIAKSTFIACGKLRDIAIPVSVTSIGDWAFQECSGLADIEIPEKVTSIGNHAFEKCTSLTTIKIPDSVTSIGENAFNDCSSLRHVELPYAIPTISKGAFNNVNTHYYYPGYRTKFVSQANRIDPGIIGMESPNYSLVHCYSDVSFNANGGSFADGGTQKKVEKIWSATKLTQEQVDSIGMPKQAGKIFLGWNTTSNATTTINPISDYVVDGKIYYAVYKDAVPATVTISGPTDNTVKAGEGSDVFTVVANKGDTDAAKAKFDFAGGKVQYRTGDTEEWVDLTSNELSIDNLTGKQFRVVPDTDAVTGQKTLTVKLMDASGDEIAGATASTAFAVTARKPAEVTIDGLDGTTVKAGEAQFFTVNVTPNDDTINKVTFGTTSGEVQWSNDGGNTWTTVPDDVDYSGLTGKKFRVVPAADAANGTVTVTVIAKADGTEAAKKDASFTVTAREHATVTINELNGKTITQNKPHTFTVTVTAHDDSGNAILTFDNVAGLTYNGTAVTDAGVTVTLTNQPAPLTFTLTPSEAGNKILTATLSTSGATDTATYTVSEYEHAKVTIDGLDTDLKQGESKNFTVTVDPKDDSGDATIDFGNKNSEIQYKDGEDWKSMPSDGLKIDLNNGKKPYDFRITPKNDGENQKLTATVKKENTKLGEAEKSYNVSKYVDAVVKIDDLSGTVETDTEKEFTVTVTANNDAGKNVTAKAGFTGPTDGVKKLELDRTGNGDWVDVTQYVGNLYLTTDNLSDISYKLRVTFAEAGNYQFDVSLTKKDAAEAFTSDSAEVTVTKKEEPVTPGGGSTGGGENPGENPGGDSGNTNPTPKPDEKPDRKIKIDGGIVEVNGKEVKPDEDGNITVKKGDEITITVDKSKISDAQVFDQWVIKPDSVLNEVDPKSEKISFTMPAEDVTIEAMTRDASIEDDGPGILGTGALIATGVVGSAALLYQGHMLGTELYLRYLLPHGAVIPQNRAELAVLLWQDAENPEPVSTTLYSDISDEDSAIQQAARWAVENDLMEQLDAEEHPDHFDPFVPVTFSDSIRAWKKAQELKK
jgi:putative conserved repeat protein